MKVEFHRKFEKLYVKLPTNVKLRFDERLTIFLNDPFDPILRNHSLSGEWQGFRSINITGDYRAIYEVADQEAILFVAIGTHNKLYS